MNKWGSVEWQHEIEAQDLLSRLSASVLFHELTKDHDIDNEYNYISYSS